VAATPAGQEMQEVAAQPAVSSPARDAWRRFRRNKAAMVSLITVLIIVLLAIFAPFLHTSDPTANNFTGTLDQAPTAHHWFGTDGLGRDYYSRVLYGLRAPLITSITGTIVTVILGALIGVIAGFYGGIVDTVLARVTDVMFAFPGFTLALIIVSLYGNALDSLFPGGGGRLMILVIVFAVVGWPGLMRFVRSLALGMANQQFIEAARTCGSSNRTIITRHLLPNMWGLILVQASFVIVGFIYTEAVLSLFGLGLQAPNPDLGQMLFEGTQKMGLNDAEYVIPSIFLMVMILAFTFLGDGIRDAVDTRGKS
jgi:peptide/nickel transport system permease protein